MRKLKIWKPLAAEHTEELVTVIIQAYHLAQRTPSMRRFAAALIKTVGWRWTADAVDPKSGVVVPDAVKYDINYLPHTPDAACIYAQYPKELSKRLTHEHTIPLNLLVEKVFSLDSDCRDTIREIFKTYCLAAIVTKEEDRKLNGLKLRSKMPPGWSYGENILARYTVINMDLLPPKAI